MLSEWHRSSPSRISPLFPHQQPTLLFTPNATIMVLLAFVPLLPWALFFGDPPEWLPNRLPHTNCLSVWTRWSNSTLLLEPRTRRQLPEAVSTRTQNLYWGWVSPSTARRYVVEDVSINSFVQSHWIVERNFFEDPNHNLWEPVVLFGNLRVMSFLEVHPESMCCISFVFYICSHYFPGNR